MQLETTDVRVTRWDFEPGAETGHHRHEFDYVVVPLISGTMTAETADGDVNGEIVAGVSYNRPAGVEHNVINSGETAFSFVEIEVLNP